MPLRQRIKFFPLRESKSARTYFVRIATVLTQQHAIQDNMLKGIYLVKNELWVHKRVLRYQDDEFAYN